MTADQQPSKWGRLAGGCIMTISGLWGVASVADMVDAQVHRGPGWNETFMAGLVSAFVSLMLFWWGFFWFRSSSPPTTGSTDC
jgi:high-affinity Fe2+/Pb2+ permease